MADLMDISQDCTENFYRDLQGFEDFSAFTHHEYYVSVPDSWYVIITDVKGSTQAISDGKYKEVNALGVASIVALLNAVSPLSIPYVFGGDGATFCIPASKKIAVEAALKASCEMAAEKFQLRLRAGVVSVKDIKQAGQQVMVAKYQPSAYYEQAMFMCSGLSYAEKLVKSELDNNPYLLEWDATKADGSFEGFECRWNEIPSPNEESVAILVCATSADEEEQAILYSKIYQKIVELYDGEDQFHPLRKNLLTLALSPRKLLAEVRIRVAETGWRLKTGYLLKLMAQILAGKWLMWRKIRTSSVDWGRYKDMLIANTDYRKFDEMLRMVITGSERQRQNLDSYLDELYQQGLIAYGLHSADKSLITCLVFNHENEHVHFLDGADGGYAMAAVQMKRQLKMLAAKT